MHFFLFPPPFFARKLFRFSQPQRMGRIKNGSEEEEEAQSESGERGKTCVVCSTIKSQEEEEEG